jgi:drug/metabolite transporter (DMT)-like permease
MERAQVPNDLENAKLVVENNENPLYIVKSEHYTQVDLTCGFCEKIINYRGLFYAALSAFFSSLTHIILRRCVYFHGSDQALIRYIIQLTVVSFFHFCYEQKSTVEKKNAQKIQTARKLLIIRGVFGAIGILAVAFSIKLINPSDTIAILSCKVILISICSKLFLKEKHSIIHIISICMAILGVLLISQPNFLIDLFRDKLNSTVYATTLANFSSYTVSNSQIIGVSLAVLAAISVTVIYTITKKICENDIQVSVIMLYASYFGVPATLFVSIIMHSFSFEQYKAGLVRFETLELALQVTLTISAGLLEVASQMFTNLALKHEDASKIALVKSNELFLTTIFQYFFLGIVANFFSKIGCLLIFSSVCMVLVHKIFDQRLKRAKKDNQKLNFFQKVIFFKF